MIERGIEFLIGVGFRVVLLDPAREAGADDFGILGHGGPVGVVFRLRVNEGHLLRAGDALVSEKHLACWFSQRERATINCAQNGLTVVYYTLSWPPTRYSSRPAGGTWPG